MTVLRKLVGKTEIIDMIRSQTIKEPCVVQPVNERMERSKREWDERVTKMDTEGLVKIQGTMCPQEDDLQVFRKKKNKRWNRS